jgi:precorrin-3B methylase
MTIDERLEAIAQTLEIVASMQKESEKRMARLDHHFASMMQSVRRLSNITIVHDLHIDDHEHRIADLETGT